MDSTDYEFHFPGLNYCGPGTDLDKRLEADGSRLPKPKYRPVDRVDEASLRHDLFYSDFTSARERIAGDDIMIKELYEIPQPTCRERFERCVVIPILFIKRSITAAFFA